MPRASGQLSNGRPRPAPRHLWDRCKSEETDRIAYSYSPSRSPINPELEQCAHILLRTGDESRERGKHRRQARTQASDENPRDREKCYRGSQKPIGPTPRKAGVGGTSNQGVLNHRRDRIKITNHNRDWVKALNEPLIMSTAPLRTTGGDHLELGTYNRNSYILILLY